MKYNVVIIAFYLSLTTICISQTLDECQRMAREHYPEMRQYNLVRQTRDYNISALRRVYLPQVNVSAQATWQNAVPEFPETMTAMLAATGMQWEGLRKDQCRAGVDVQQLIWDGGATRAAIAVQDAETRENESRADVNLYGVEQRVNDLYFGLLLLNEQLAQLEQTKVMIEANFVKMQSYVRNGAAMQSDADAVEAQLLTIQQQREQMKATRASYANMLSLFTGTTINADSLQRPIDNAPTAVQVEESRPELQLLDATMAKLAAKEQQIKASTMPAFAAFVQGFYGYPGYDYFTAMQTGEMSLNAMVGIRMNWSLGAYYNKKARLGSISAAKAMAEVNRDVFLFNNNMQATRQSDNIATLRSMLADDERILTLRTNVRHAAEARLNNGVIDATDLLTKITDEYAAAMTRNSREIELLKAIYELKHTINK